jgi:hypothetical protein
MKSEENIKKAVEIATEISKKYEIGNAAKKLVEVLKDNPADSQIGYLSFLAFEEGKRDSTLDFGNAADGLAQMAYAIAHAGDCVEKGGDEECLRKALSCAEKAKRFGSFWTKS